MIVWVDTPQTNSVPRRAPQGAQRFLVFRAGRSHRALPLKLALETLGLDVFLDEEDIPPWGDAALAGKPDLQRS